MADKLPVFWPGWETVKVLGRGSFGTVYEIRRDVLGTTERAALKVISIPKSSNEIDELYSEGFDQESITRRFQSYLKDIVQEYALMQEMKGHTNIVYCDDLRYIQRSDGIGWDIYIKMELLTAMTKALPLDVPEEVVIKAGLDLCSALMLCKKKHIVHRDIKPQNIFLSKDGDFKLGDFGIARTMDHTTSGTKTGTYKYMAPEVYHNQPYGAASDIYSLGLVLYWLLNQRRMAFLPLPPRTPTVSEEDSARARRLNGETLPAPLHGSRELQRIVLKACAFRPEDRYDSPAQMHQELSALAGKISDFQTISVSTRITPADEDDERTQLITDSRKKKSKRPLIAALAGILALAAGFWVLHPHQWTPATCESPETCSICGKTQGESGVHAWQDATCSAPQTCADCGLTQGAAASHQWNGATCSAPETCDFCGLTQGDLGDHAFREATYTAPATCAHCGLTQGQRLQSPLDGGHGYSVVLLSDGTVYNKGVSLWGHNNLSDWTDIQEISASPGFITGLKADGTVVCQGLQVNGPSEVVKWTDIVQVASDSLGTIGLKSDGTCVIAGSRMYGMDRSSSWYDIVAIDAFAYHRVGLKADGTVVAAGEDNYHGQLDVSDWTDIVDVAVGASHTVGLKADGTVVAVGDNSYGQCSVWKLTDVVAIDAGGDFTVALHADGTVTALGDNSEGQCDVSDWTDILCIGTGALHVLGLKADGTILGTGLNNQDQCNLPGLTVLK